jgi:hypothetical protein
VIWESRARKKSAKVALDAIAKRDELERKLKQNPDFLMWLALGETIAELERMASR